MSDLRKTTTTTADEPKKAGCCDGDQDKHGPGGFAKRSRQSEANCT